MIGIWCGCANKREGTGVNVENPVPSHASHTVWMMLPSRQIARQEKGGKNLRIKSKSPMSWELYAAWEQVKRRFPGDIDAPQLEALRAAIQLWAEELVRQRFRGTRQEASAQYEMAKARYENACGKER